MYHCVDASQDQRNDTFILSRALHSRRATHAPAISAPSRPRASPTGASLSDRPIAAMADVSQLSTARVHRVGWVRSSFAVGRVTMVKRNRRSSFGFTAGGAPFGLRVSDFDPADLEAMGLPGVSGSRIHGPGGWLPEPHAARGSDDARAHVAPGHVR
jgi:hypothetical protein